MKAVVKNVGIFVAGIAAKVVIDFMVIRKLKNV